MQKVIWVPARKGVDVTDGHIDGLARFISPGKVLLSPPSQLDSSVWTRIYQEAKDILTNTTDAKGRKLHVVEVAEADMYSVGLDRHTLKDIENGKEDAPTLTYVNYLLVKMVSYSLNSVTKRPIERRTTSFVTCTETARLKRCTWRRFQC